MNVLQDIRFALRMAAKSPGFTAVVVLTLALGIGANTTVFTLVNAVLFRGMPFDRPDEIVALTGLNLTKTQSNTGLSYLDVADMRTQSKSFRDLALYGNVGINLSNEGNVPERYEGARVGTNLFSLLGVRPVVGRDFAAEDGKPGANPTALISNSVWKNRYGSSTAVVGRVVRINEVPTTIIGVMPPDMQFPNNQEMWLALIPKGEGEKRDARDFTVVARLKEGVSIAAARAEMDLMTKNLEASYPATNKDYSVRVRTMNDLMNGGPIRMMFLSLMGAVGFVLLIACCNVANLLLSRSLGRAREVSIRTALGASRWRVVRQMLIECVLYSLTGALIGLVLAAWGIRTFDAAVANSGKPYWIKFVMDGTVFFYVTAICLGSSFLFGLVPALHTTKIDLNTVLKEGGRGSAGGRTRWFSEALVIGELALAVILLTAAGLMVRSFMKLYSIDSIDHPENVLQMRLTLVNAKYPKPEQRQQFFDRLLAKLQIIPGAESVALSSDAPLEGARGWRFEIEGAPPVESEEKRPSVSGLIVTPGYFQTVHVPLLRGRDFTDSDGTQGKTSTVVTQGFATKYWGNEDPLGKRFRLSRGKDDPWMTVVGVVKDYRQTRYDREEIEPLIFVPYRQESDRGMAVLARGRNAGGLAEPIRRAIAELDRDLPADQVATSAERIARQQWAFKVFGSMFAIFATVALAMASIGLYAVISYGVGRRTQEIGVRMALGASAASVAGMILKNGGRQIVIGLVLGLAGAFAVTRALATILVQITPTDPVTFASVTVLLASVALLACWIPARRAMRVDPLVALRYE